MEVEHCTPVTGWERALTPPAQGAVYGQLTNRPFGIRMSLRSRLTRVTRHSPSTIINDPEPNHIPARCSILPTQIEGGHVPCAARGLGLGNITERSITYIDPVFETLLEETDTCAITQLTPGKKVIAPALWLTTCRTRGGESIPSGETCEILEGACFEVGLMGCYERVVIYTALQYRRLKKQQYRLGGRDKLGNKLERFGRTTFCRLINSQAERHWFCYFFWGRNTHWE